MLTLRRCTVYFLILVLLLFLQQNVFAQQSYIRKVGTQNVQIVQDINKLRVKRAIYKPGFFWTLGSSIFQTFNETKSAYYQIRKLLNDQFIDERTAAQRATSTTAAPNKSVSTTTEPYKITRREFNRILMRNLKGLARLYNLELQDALKQSQQNQADFNKQLRVSIKQELS